MLDRVDVEIGGGGGGEEFNDRKICEVIGVVADVEEGGFRRIILSDLKAHFGFKVKMMYHETFCLMREKHNNQATSLARFSSVNISSRRREHQPHGYEIHQSMSIVCLLAVKNVALDPLK